VPAVRWLVTAATCVHQRSARVALCPTYRGSCQEHRLVGHLHSFTPPWPCLTKACSLTRFSGPPGVRRPEHLPRLLALTEHDCSRSKVATPWRCSCPRRLVGASDGAAVCAGAVGVERDAIGMWTACCGGALVLRAAFVAGAVACDGGSMLVAAWFMRGESVLSQKNVQEHALCPLSPSSKRQPHWPGRRQLGSAAPRVCRMLEMHHYRHI
jgi:hypothetical protein